MLAAAVTGKRHHLLGFQCQTLTATGTHKFQTGSTDMGSTWSMAINGINSFEFTPCGWLRTNAGEALNLVTVGASAAWHGFAIIGTEK